MSFKNKLLPILFEREVGKDSDYIPGEHVSQGLTTLKPGAENLVWVFHVSGRRPTACPQVH